MKQLAAFVLATALLASCSKREDTTLVSDTAMTVSSDPAMAVERVASDKDLLRQSLVLASTKGTLDAALTEAVADSAVRASMTLALRMAKPLASADVNKPAAARSTTSTKKSTTGQTATSKKDAFDQTEDALNKADRTVTRTGDVIKKTEDVGRKVDDIFKRK